MKHLHLTLFMLLLTGRLLLAQGSRADTSNVRLGRKISQTITPDTYTGRQIIVGSGGGFTGFSSSYYLLENGKLFGRRSRDTVFTFIRQQPITTTKRLFTRLEGTCRIKKTKFNNPGNTYKFVRWRKGKLMYTVTWGAVGKTLPVSYPAFYTSFMTLVPASGRLE